MFRKLRLKRQIKQIRKRIEEIERKRARSQAALVEAILTHTTPNDDDVDFFNRFTAQIEEQRNLLHQVQAELDSL